jgi:hypothetical protein
VSDFWTKGKWNDALEATGEVFVQARFRSGAIVVNNAKIEPPREFTLQWLARRARQRERTTAWRFLAFVVSFVGVGAAVIAVWLTKQ